VKKNDDLLYFNKIPEQKEEYEEDPMRKTSNLIGLDLEIS
jgi:hypothetical protein